MDRQDWEGHDIVTALPRERARLVRLCTRLTGDASAAEDLVQDTFVEAWRHRHKLEGHDGLHPWLSAIGRNVCRRWMRERQGEPAVVPASHAWDALLDGDEAEAADSCDPVYELERAELADLLDRALALLPPQTRDALVEKYVWDHSQDEIAARLGVNAGTVSMRLQRGKLALRRVLEQDLRAEAATYGLGRQGADAAQSTRIWCPFCGQQRLRAYLDPVSGAAAFRCPACSSRPQENVVSTRQAALLRGVRSHRIIVSRQLTALHRTLSHTLDAGIGPCIICGRPVPIRRVAPGARGHAPGVSPGIYAFCDRCHPAPPSLPWFSRGASALRLPDTQRFWRLHPRMRLLPDRPLTCQGEAAMLTCYQSLSGPATLNIISGRDTFAILTIHASTSI